jgi:hypothetical protein
VLLKGMALEHTLYGSKGLRQMTDNDILVKREDALKAWNLLKQNGYLPGLIKSPLHAAIQIDIGKHLPGLIKDDYSIDIHHKLFTKTNSDNSMREAVDSSIEISIDGTTAWILPPELQLMHLISHYKRHLHEGNCQLRLYADIILLDKSCNINMPDSFLLKPQQSLDKKAVKNAFRINLNSIPPDKRFRFLIGDIFPSLQWMKKRYKCNGMMAILHYPFRVGKLGWLV